MRKLILIKHSLPEIDPDVPASLWHLNDEGRQRCVELAAALAPHAPARFVASTEPKAAETAGLAAAILGLPVETADGLHEHRRENVPYQSREDFTAAVARFFAEPDDLVFGMESAAEARRRFAMAVMDVLDRYHEGNIAVVAHGTVISLFVATVAGLDPFELWQRLELPSFIVLSVPSLDLLEIRDTVSQ